MASLSVTHPTLLDFTRELDPKGKIDKMVEIIAEENEVQMEMTWQEGNNTLGHRTTVLSGLPTPTWRKLYGGVQPTKGETIQVTETVGFMEAFAEVDKKLANLGGNAVAFRKSQDRKHILGMRQEFSNSLFNANEAVNPERFTGFGPRFNSLSANNAENIIVTDNTFGGVDIDSGTTPSHSMYLVGWSPDTVFGIFPSGSIAGLQRTDYGETVIESIDGAGGRMVGYRTHFSWDCGLCVADWRYVVRIQYDQSELDAARTNVNLIDLMSIAVDLPPSGGGAKFAWYGNRTAKNFLRRQIADRVSSSTLTMESVAGKPVMMFDGIPFRRVDSLSVADAATIT